MTPEQFHMDWISLSGTFWRVARYILGDDAEAEDAVQELYLRLWRGRDALDGIRSPKGYGITVLRNLCLDRIRQRSRTEADGGQAEPECPGSHDETMDVRARLAKTLAAIETLPERQRIVLTLKVFDGLDYAEIARRTGINYLSLRVLLSQARRKLKNKLL